jgi:tRNA pseudouridine38-40 synthase
VNVEPAASNFHARHDAVARSYVYQISTRRTAFGKKFVWWIKDQLDPEIMNEAAKLFVGLKDFRNFTDSEQEQGSTKTEIIKSEITVVGDIILFHIIGSHFLWKQVRRLTGVLVETGRGKLSVADVASFFKGVTDVPAKLTSPPSGLFLENVYYSREEIKSDPVPVIRVF